MRVTVIGIAPSDGRSPVVYIVFVMLLPVIRNVSSAISAAVYSIVYVTPLYVQCCCKDFTSHLLC